MKRRRLLFVSHTLPGGGTERIVAFLLQYLNRPKFEPLLVAFPDRFGFPVPEDVRIICFHEKGVKALPRLIWRLARVYRKENPDTVVSMDTYVNLVAVLARKLSCTKPRLLLIVVNQTSIYLKQKFQHQFSFF